MGSQHDQRPQTAADRPGRAGPGRVHRPHLHPRTCKTRSRRCAGRSASARTSCRPGWYIAAWFWDIESGGLDIEQRGHGTAHEQFAAIGIPRDGGLADLLAEAASPEPRFAAVICEDIERSGRDTFNALKLESS